MSSSKMAFWQTATGLVWGIDPDGQCEQVADFPYQFPLSMDEFRDVVRGFLFCQELIAMELLGVMLEPERLYFHQMTREFAEAPWEGLVESSLVGEEEDRPAIAIDPGCGYGVIRYRDMVLTRGLGDFITICRIALRFWAGLRAQGEELDSRNVLEAAEQIILESRPAGLEGDGPA